MLVFLLAFSTTNANSIDLKSHTSVSVKAGYITNAFCRLIQMGNYEAVKSLIDTGEDVNRKSKGLTPLMFAARQNKVKIVKLLIKSGAKLNTKSENGARLTALQIAERSKAVDVVKVLKEAL